MTTKGLDSASQITRAAAAAAQAQGRTVWFRYLYNLLRSEIDLAHEFGFAVSLIGEHDTRTHHPIHDGYATGKAHGANDAATAASLGAPSTTVLWATADDKVFVGQDELNMGAYLDGYRYGVAGRYRVGLYGGAQPVQFALQGGHAAFGWVAGASYWNNGIEPGSVGAIAHQLAEPYIWVGGVECDSNDIFTLGDWAWLAPAQTSEDPAPTPTPIPIPIPDPIPVPEGDDEMFYTLMQETDLATKVPLGPVYAVFSNLTKVPIGSPDSFANDAYIITTYLEAKYKAPPPSPDPLTLDGIEVWRCAPNALIDFLVPGTKTEQVGAPPVAAV